MRFRPYWRGFLNKKVIKKLSRTQRYADKFGGKAYLMKKQKIKKVRGRSTAYTPQRNNSRRIFARCESVYRNIERHIDGPRFRREEVAV